jgi:hypothetical protein
MTNISGIYLFKSVGYDNFMGGFSSSENYFTYYENPALLEGSKTYLTYYRNYNRKELETILISQSYETEYFKAGFYILHFQRKPYKEEEYGIAFSRKIYTNFFFGINLKYLRNIVFKKTYRGFSYDIGGFYIYNHHNFGVSFRNVEKPYLLDRINMDFIFKYSYKRKYYNINFRYVKIYSQYEYYLIGCELKAADFIKLSYSLTTKKKENRMGVKISYDQYVFDAGYVIHPGLSNYMIFGVGIIW